ncbi:hypothetical protein [Mucilaginibacter aquaedulcis]|uniref:hypothetical protein n=1 Tax=Mucilaginibacter aquaedulcis TaxID=1187081 RepID=UPI0025B297BC|nr:hypothetical protein [Mucilaginibacter aquaedulcis]MDN3548698.1 hypothetical protein [Mucilaginibacter aquaedulcis]
MSKHIEKLKKELIELAAIVNSFKSEAVQVRILDRLLDLLTESTNKHEYEFGTKNSHSNDESTAATEPKKNGATKILHQLLQTDFFNEYRSISEIVEYCNEHFNADIKTTELSGILLKLVKENRLKRERSTENNRFKYVRA